MEEGYLPKSLAHFVRTYNCMRKEVRLNIVSGTSASASGLIRIELPQGLCDLSTFRLSGNLACVTDASNGAMFPPTYMMVRRYNALVGGVNVGAMNNHFNHTALAVRKSACAVALDQGELEANHDWSKLVPTAAAAAGTAGANGYRVFKWFPYTINQIGGSGVLDTNIWGKTYLEVQLESGQCMIAATVLTGGTQQTSFNYTISDIRAFVDVLYLPNASYDSAMRSRLNAGGVIKSVVPNVISAIQLNTGANVFNVSTGSLDKYIVAGLDSTYNTAGSGTIQLYSGTNRGTPFSSFVAEGTGGSVLTYPVTDSLANGLFSLTIGSEVFPAYGLVQNTQVGASLTQKAFGKSSIYNYNQLYTGRDASGSTLTFNQDYYLSQNFIVATDLSLEGGAAEHASQLISGLSTQGAMAVIRWDSNSFNASNYWLMAGVCSGILSAGAGGAVSWQQ